MNTASQQSVGGSQAAAEGAGNLAAARTRNAGAFAPAISEANRAGGRQLSQNAVGIQAANENERQSQRSRALAALQGLYGTNENTALGFGNAETGALNAATNAQNQTLGNTKFWANALGTPGPAAALGI